jgi:hypothetical protein
MWRALLFFALALGVVYGGLLLLRNSAGKPPPRLPRKPIERLDQDKDKDRDDDESGW